MNEEFDPKRLQELLDAAARLPREVEPGRDAWPAIRARIDAQRVRSIAPADAPEGVVARRTWWPLAAAAVLIAAAGIAVATRRSPQLESPVAQTTAPAAPSLPPASVATPVATPVAVNSANPALAAALDDYREASRELEAEVAAHAAGLSPSTREVVRRSLATIDTAIADLRAALGADPRDVAAGQALSLVYERKLEFLKRVRALPAAGM